MAKLDFKQLRFEEEKEGIRTDFLSRYYFYIDKDALRRIGAFDVKKNSISFKNVPYGSARRKFDLLLMKGFDNLRNRLTNRRSYYIYKNSGIPLMGCLYFGIVDKGSGMIEIKPSTGCNMNCIFCSVDEGKDSKRLNDYLIEREYIVEETKNLLDFKKENAELYINPHGEPLLYPEIAELCKGLAELRYCSSITIITAATLLTRPLIDSLAETKKTRLNVSMHAMDENAAKRLFGTDAYNLLNVTQMLRYASKKMGIILAPVLLPGFNESEIPKIIDFAREIKAKLYVQKFLKNTMGRNPLKEEGWNSFFSRLSHYEQETGYNLVNNELTELIEKNHTKELPVPFKANQTVQAKIVLPGRFRNEKLAAAMNRIISVPNCTKEIGEECRIRILKTRHNIIMGNIIIGRIKN